MIYSLKTYLYQALHAVMFFLFPPYCYYCHDVLSTTSVLCQQCLARIQPVISHSISISPIKQVTVYAIGAYQHPLKKLITAKHFRCRHSAQSLGVLLWERTALQLLDFDCIVPLPLHWSRYAHRWYNQAEEMALRISNLSNKPCVSLLQRTKKTKFQAGLSQKQRYENVHDIFSLTQEASLYRNKTIVLIDDVMTTGATIKEAVKVLYTLQPKAIIVAVACRVI